MKTLLTIATAACLALPAAHAADPGGPPPAPAAQKNRLVLQVSDDDLHKWNTVLNNVHNVQAELGRDNVEVEVVAYGPGIGLLKADSLVANRVEEAMAEGVHFVACQNTMRGMNLTTDDMIDKIDYTPAGIVRLMQREQQGWAYIRP
jgi:intracellular sulfur oxidation DsrE/DsrF family protein